MIAGWGGVPGGTATQVPVLAALTVLGRHFPLGRAGDTIEGAPNPVCTS